MSTLPVKEYFSSSDVKKYFLANIFFMNFMQESLPGVFTENVAADVNSPLWTIKNEIGFYLIVPLIALIISKCKTRKRINMFLLGMYLLAYVYRFVCVSIYESTGNAFFLYVTHQLPGFLQYFSVGIFCAINYDFIRKSSRYLIIPAVILFFLHYVIGGDIMYSDGIGIDLLLPASIGIIVMFIAFGFPALNGIGQKADYSYGVYVFHLPVLQTLIALGYFQLNKYVAILIGMGTVFSIAYMSWHFVERKFLKK
jgi:peptidoglycan/LPS O-acetylase OafA/YrhL